MISSPTHSTSSSNTSPPATRISWLTVVQCVCSLLFVSDHLAAQSPWTRLTTNDGLLQNMVTDIELDHRGFLWFGSQSGLSYYDGYSFRYVEPDPRNPSSLSPGTVSMIHDCESTGLFVSYVTGAIDIYDPVTGIVRHIVPSGPSIVGGKMIHDPQGVHWIRTTNSGIWKLTGSAAGDGVKAKWKSHFRYAQSTFALKGLRNLYVDARGTLWVVIEDGVYGLDSAADGDSDTLSATHRLPTGAGAPLAVTEDEDTNYWVAETDGLLVIDRSYKIKHRFPLNIGQSIPGSAVFARDPSSRDIWLLHTDICLRFKGGDPANGNVVNLPDFPGAKSTLLLDILVDSSGVVWVGTSGRGIIRYSNRHEMFGVSSKIDWQAEENKLRSAPIRRHAALARDDQFMQALVNRLDFRDSRGLIWCAGDDGLRRFDPKTDREALYDYGYGSRNIMWARFFDCAEDLRHGVWFVGRNEFLSRYDRATDSFSHFCIVNGRLLPAEAAGTGAEAIRSFYIGGSGGYWIGTARNGVYRVDLESLELRAYRGPFAASTSAYHPSVLGMMDDPVSPQKYLWVGTEGGGVYRMDKESGASLLLTKRDGMRSSVVYCLLPDEEGMLWMSTNNGLARLDPKSLSTRWYDHRDGLQGKEFNRQQYIRQPDGTLIFGGTDGINVFRPDRIRLNNRVPTVVITGITIQARETTISGFSLTGRQTDNVGMNVLTLPYSDNAVKIECASLDFSNPGKNLYSWRLDGLEEEWSAPSPTRFASYTNLSPGHYTFLLRGSNDDGVWNLHGPRVRIEILPPWYGTWWAYGAYCLFAVTLLLYIRSFEIRRMRLQARLEQQRIESEKLREVDKLKMQFFQNISHEFRTPLTLILGPIQRMLESSSAVASTHELRMIRRNANQLLRLINQILDLTRLESGGAKLSLRSGDVIPFLRGITMSFQSLADRKGIVLDFVATQRELPMGYDSDKLEKIVVNLLSNAFKFTPENGEVTVRVSTQSGMVLVFEVEDTGIGIPDDVIEHIFDRFYQGEYSSSRGRTGSGIGLALVKELVQLHEGSIEVQSEPGRGARFSVRIPIQKLTPTDDSGPTETDVIDRPAYPIDDLDGTDEGDNLNEARGKKAKGVALVIEDNGDMRRFLRMCLQDEFDVIEENDGQSGVDRALQAVPDIVISDVMMPGLDGFEVCRRIKSSEVTNHVPVILLTARAGREDRLSGLELGADEYLSKPFDAKELLIRTRNLLETRRILRERFAGQSKSLLPGEVQVESMQEKFLSKVMQAIEAHLSQESFGVTELAADIGLSSKQLQRKIRAITNMTANEFIQFQRLHRGRDLILKKAGTISEIAYAVGFSSPSYFSQCFKAQFGHTPSEAADAHPTGWT